MQALYHITRENDWNGFILASNEHLLVSNSHGHTGKKLISALDRPNPKIVQVLRAKEALRKKL